MSSIKFSVFTSKTASPMGKTFTLAGKHLQKQTKFPARATVQRCEAASLFEFVQRIASLRADQAFSLGCCEFATADVFTQRDIPTYASALPAVARTRKHFSWLAGKGVIFLDYDPVAGEAVLASGAIVNLLRDAIPELRFVTIAQKISSSSCLKGPDQVEITGVRGQHFFMIADNAEDIPAIVELLANRLWLGGLGRYDLTATGRMIERSLFDLTVWQPERIIFSRANCKGGITQHLPAPTIFPGECDEAFGEVELSLSRLPPLTVAQSGNILSSKKRARDALRDEAEARRSAWASSKANESAGLGATEAQISHLRDTMLAALTKNSLPEDLILKCSDGRTPKVRDLLSDPAAWDGVSFADPAEPDYRGDNRIAIALLNGRLPPAIFSHAHGGISYALKPGTGTQCGPNEFEDLTLSAGDLASPEKFQVISAADFAVGAPPSWIIKNVLPRQSLAMVYGPSGSGKSFLILDMLWAMATGTDWAGHATKPCRVVYVAAEGKAGLRLRLRAFQEARRTMLSDLPFGVIADTPNLCTGDVEDLIAKIRHYGGADVLVIDTLAQASSGADENSAQDMGPILTKCAEIIEKLAVTVVLVHHSGKDAARGSRGWSGLKGALDTELRVERHEDHSSVTISKQKDGPEGETVYFELKAVDLGFDEDGDPVTSRVVNHLDIGSIKKAGPKGKWQTKIIATLKGLEDFGDVQIDLLIASVIKMHLTDNPEAPAPRKDPVKRAIFELVRSGFLSLRNGLVSSTNFTNHHNA